MMDVQCPSTLKIKQLNNSSLVCQQLDIQRVSNLLAMIQHVGLLWELLLKRGIYNILCAPSWAHTLPLVQRYGISVVLVLTSITHTTLLWSLPQKYKCQNTRMFYSIQRGYGVCVYFSGHSDLQCHGRYSERVTVQGAMLWHSMAQLCAQYVQNYVLQ